MNGGLEESALPRVDTFSSPVYCIQLYTMVNSIGWLFQSARCRPWSTSCTVRSTRDCLSIMPTGPLIAYRIFGCSIPRPFVHL